MKKIQLLATLLIAVLAISCGKKKESQNIIVPTVEKEEPKAPIRMQPYDQKMDVEWLAKGYQVIINRQADDSLRMVQDETGQKFVDNRYHTAYYPCRWQCVLQEGVYEDRL